MSQGTLQIVSTPIGNLADITLRAIDALKGADLILSEDTRETDKLLRNLNIHAKQISYRDENHLRVIEPIKTALDAGQKLVLVSDSGTPLISDPGYKLVQELAKGGYKTEVIPGPSSVVSALVVSALPTDKFTFLGFLPRTKGTQKELLLKYGQNEATLVIFESPYMVLNLLNLVLEVLGDRECALVKDQTKIFEKVWRSKVSVLKEELKAVKLKGEFILLVSKQDYER